MTTKTIEVVKTEYEKAFKKLVLRYWLTGLAVFLVGGILGGVMRMSQTAPFLGPAWYYRSMTFHGLSMNGFIIAALIGIGWLVIVKVLGIQKPLGRIELVYWLLVAGLAVDAFAIFIGGFATGFPAMPPLPVFPAGAWPRWATAVFLIGLALIVLGAITFFIDWLVAAHKAMGGLDKALGLNLLFRDKSKQVTSTLSPAVLCLTAMSVVGTYALSVGVYLVANIFIRNLTPAFSFDPMMAKNALWMFGHTLVNVLFWGTFAAVYLLVPAYTGREWKAYRLLVVGWLTTITTTGMTAFLHHMQMDFAIPVQLLLFGQITTYVSVIPWAGVSVYGALARIWRSGTDWKPPLMFIYLGLFGFIIGIAAAFLDTTIGFNQVLHNTLWVPAHFHTYIMMGGVLFIFAAIYHFLPDITGKKVESRLPAVHFWMTLVGGLGFVTTLYLAGLLNAPRRFAEFPYNLLPDGLKLVSGLSIPFIIVLVLGQFVFVYYLLRTIFPRAK